MLFKEIAVIFMHAFIGVESMDSNHKPITTDVSVARGVKMDQLRGRNSPT
jgi:hypothetical protein